MLVVRERRGYIGLLVVIERRGCIGLLVLRERKKRVYWIARC